MMPKLFYGCKHCPVYRECVIEEKYGDDCPVEAFEKAKADLKQAFEETRFFKAAVWMADKLESVLEKLRLR